MLRVRIKYSKTGAVKFLGHLDIMRYFQKAIKRAGLHPKYSEGYSPHIIMSFALPLGVGITSEGEYFDLDLVENDSSDVMKQKLDAAMAPGFQICSVRQIGETKAEKAMTLVNAASYMISMRDHDLWAGWQEHWGDFLAQDQINVVVSSKKGDHEKDIRPFILEAKIHDNALVVFSTAGSVNNLKMQTVMKAFAEYSGILWKASSVSIHRTELYTKNTNGYQTLESLGEEIH